MTVPDGFLNPTSNVIYNRLGITNQDELRVKEADYSLPAMLRVIIGVVDIPGQFDARHLRAIHRELFQDVYEWAGQTRANGPDGPFQGQKLSYVRDQRTGDIMRYGPYQQLDQRLDAIGEQLAKENNLRGLSPQQFAQRAAYYFDQYNHAHAFREGNGRTIQSTLAILGRQAGYQVEIEPAVAGRLNDVRDLAIIRPFGPEQPEQNLAALTLLLAASTRPLPGPEAEQLRHASQARPLREPTPAMQRIEALRVLQSSAYVVGEALRDIDRGDPRRGNQLLQDMNALLHGQATATQTGPGMQKAALEVSKHPVLKNETALVSQAASLGKSVQQLVKLEQPAPAQQQAQAPQQPATLKQKPLKRRRPNL